MSSSASRPLIMRQPPPTVKRRANRPAFQSWPVPAVRHELILYAELFAAVLVMFALRDFALTPWEYVDRMHNLEEHNCFEKNRSVDEVQCVPGSDLCLPTWQPVNKAEIMPNKDEESHCGEKFGYIFNKAVPGANGPITEWLVIDGLLPPLVKCRCCSETMHRCPCGFTGTNGTHCFAKPLNDTCGAKLASSTFQREDLKELANAFRRSGSTSCKHAEIDCEWSFLFSGTLEPTKLCVAALLAADAWCHNT